MKKTITLLLAITTVAAAFGQDHHQPMTKPGAPPQSAFGPMMNGMSAKEVKIAEEMMKKGTPEESRVWSHAMMSMMGAGKMKNAAIMARASKGMSKADAKLLTDSYAKLNKDQQAVCRKMLMNMALMKAPKGPGMGHH